MAGLVGVGPVVLEKKMKIWTVYDNDNDDEDNDGQRTNFDQKSSLEMNQIFRKQEKKYGLSLIFESEYSSIQ